ncbi:MAG: hypothetical protein ACO3Q7_08280 [Steroidobacteraceae bacterium]
MTAFGFAVLPAAVFEATLARGADFFAVAALDFAFAGALGFAGAFDLVIDFAEALAAGFLTGALTLTLTLALAGARAAFLATFALVDLALPAGFLAGFLAGFFLAGIGASS